MNQVAIIMACLAILLQAIQLTWITDRRIFALVLLFMGIITWYLHQLAVSLSFITVRQWMDNSTFHELLAACIMLDAIARFRFPDTMKYVPVWHSVPGIFFLEIIFFRDFMFADFHTGAWIFTITLVLSCVGIYLLKNYFIKILPLLLSGEIIGAVIWCATRNPLPDYVVEMPPFLPLLYLLVFCTACMYVGYFIFKRKQKKKACNILIR